MFANIEADVGNTEFNSFRLPYFENPIQILTNLQFG